MLADTTVPQTLMDDQTANRLVVGLSLCFLVIGFAVIYPVSTADPQTTKPASERFSVKQGTTYQATGRIAVDGTLSIAYEGIVGPNGERYQTLIEESVSTEQYQREANATVYERMVLTDADAAEQRRDRVIEDDDRTLIRETRDEGRTTLVVAKNDTNLAADISGSAGLFIRSLQLAGYDAVRNTSGGKTVFKPSNGWYGREEPYRIGGATGTVRADRKTNAVVEADVSWTVTSPASSVAEYLLVSLTSEEPRKYDISFSVEDNQTEVERPQWVDRIHRT